MSVGYGGHALQSHVDYTRLRPLDEEKEGHRDAFRSGFRHCLSRILAGRYNLLTLEDYPLTVEMALELSLVGAAPGELAFPVLQRRDLKPTHLRGIQPPAGPGSRALGPSRRLPPFFEGLCQGEADYRVTVREPEKLLPDLFW